ncbi:MAG: DUF2306 domain-containing protein [Rhodospirillaceae bacterium]|nr:DUF2306 domain-containing protein [Rhodospirillaceae bacterium]
MRLDDISLLGWLHSAACMVALFAGPLVFALRKGTRFHRRAGYWYVGSMVIANLTALGLFAPIAGLPAFNMFHWMAIVTLLFVGLGVWAARNQRARVGAYGHPVMMILSFYLLIGGAVNEAFSRIGGLRNAAMAGSPWATNIAQTKMLGMAQGAAMMVALAMIVWFVGGVARKRSRLKRMQLAPAE